MSSQQLLGLLALFLPAAGWADTPEQILKSTGVTGGLVVHVGCGDGQQTLGFLAGEAYLVHGLDADPKNVAAARTRIRSAGAYGRVSVDVLAGQRLPYKDNLVNLLVSQDLGQVEIDEVMRVLCPGGTAYLKRGAKWSKVVKPWPEDIDEWTHYLHGPDNNAVAHDQVVDRPQSLQWLGEPKFARAHEQMASLSACVTTGGRLFYIVDEAPRADIRFPSKWFLVARDAFNGVVLWKRPISSWVDQLRRFRSGPAETAFRLAAQDDRVYVTLGIEAPVSILDAVTGETLATCEGTEHARQVLRIGEFLVVLVDTRPETTKEEDSKIRRGLDAAPGRRAIVGNDATQGTKLWQIDFEAFAHPSLAAHGESLFYQTDDRVVCCDLASGAERWQTAAEWKLSGHELGWESPTLVADDRAVYCADFQKILALSVKDGSQLWQSATAAGYNSPPDVFLIDDLVWTKKQAMIGLDASTGESKREIPTVKGYMHARCYRNKATDRFFLLGNQGVQFVDHDSGDAALNHWIRGTCQYGIMPANGLLYVTPDSCACNMKTKLSGLWTLASEPSRGAPTETRRLEKGDAYGRIDGVPSTTVHPDDWPVYRRDFSRSGRTRSRVAADLRPAWRTEIGGRLSGITVAGGKMFVAAVDEHTVYALDEKSGAEQWSYTAGGRVDSPPTIMHGLAVFGSADGWVYALRAEDGALVWRFRAAPNEVRSFVNGQLESLWPVHGSVLVHRGQLVVAAGRSSYLDGGIRLYCLEPRTGELLSQTEVYSPDPESGKQPPADSVKDVRGLLSDILLADGDDVYMRHVKLDLESGSETGTGVHLFCPVGFLDDTWWHRGYWVFHDEFIAHWSGWWKIGNVVPSGRIMSYDDVSVFGYGRDKYPSGNTGQWRGGEQYRLFACDRPSPEVIRKAPPPKAAVRKGRRRNEPALPEPPTNRWETQLPFYVRAMAAAADVLFVAGPPELTATQGTGEESLVLSDPDEAVAAWKGEKGGLMRAVSARDGNTLFKYELDAPPVFDGMAAARGKLFLALTNGSIVCYAE